MWYFENFPNVNYQVNGENTSISLVNITKRFKFKEEVIKNRYILIKYTIKEFEKPFMVANDYYGDPTLDWIILLTNLVIDPYFDWPLTDEEFSNYITLKYGSIQDAKNQIENYQLIIQPKHITLDNISVPEKTINIDQTQYLSTPVSDRKTISKYDLELGRNEDKRQVKIIDKRFVAKILEEFKDLYVRR